MQEKNCTGLKNERLADGGGCEPLVFASRGEEAQMLAGRMRSPRPFASVKKTQQLVGGSDGTEFFVSLFSLVPDRRQGARYAIVKRRDLPRRVRLNF